jgi:hypothetical protein
MMFRIAAVLAIAVAILLTAGTSSAGTRRAFLVGSHNGNVDQATLRYTSDDVHRLAAVLKELGGIPAATTTELIDPSAADVSARLDALAKTDKSDLFVFYYSGHADGASLSLGGTSLPLADLMAKIAATPATTRIIIIDACQSGAATRAKGVTVAEPFDVQVQASASTGDVVITSSSASEASYEADSSRAGVFSLHLATALRGAGDVDGDGAVTVSEAYRYAYAQTLRSTLLTRGGPQHPSFRYAVEGQREPVLTWIGTSAKLTLRAAEVGDFVLFDDRESRVLAELRVEKGKQVRVALAPGQYVVKKRGLRDLRSARIGLASNDDRVLEEEQMPATALLRLPPKGGLGNLAFGLSAGQVWSGLGDAGNLQLQVGPEWEHGTWLFRGEAVLAFGTQEHNDLVTRQQSGGIALSALTGFHLGGLVLRGGPLLASEIVFQQPRGRPTQSALAFRIGPRLRLDVPVTRNIGIYSNLDLDIMAVRIDQDSLPGRHAPHVGGIGILSFIAYGIGFGSAW